MSKEARAVLASAAAVAGGLAVAGTTSQTAGGVVLVLGWLGFVYSLHRYGRAAEG
jgi:hypothetical protein